MYDNATVAAMLSNFRLRNDVIATYSILFMQCELIEHPLWFSTYTWIAAILHR